VSSFYAILSLRICFRRIRAGDVKASLQVGTFKFPDGRCYVCSYLFDTTLFFAQMQAIFEPLRSLDWRDREAVEAATRKALMTVLEDENRPVIRQILLALPGQPELLRLCEHYDILDKVVLCNDPAGSARGASGAMALLSDGSPVLVDEPGRDPSAVLDVEAVLPRPGADSHGIDGVGLAARAGGSPPAR
jgi:hypothetical protein